MFKVIQQFEYETNRVLLDQMFKLRKRVFKDQLGWDVPIRGAWEYDEYDVLGPAYLVWTDEAEEVLYGCVRLMPTTGPTLLYDVFRRTFPEKLNLAAPGIWEGTRMCIDEAAIARDLPDIVPARAFCMLLLALCEVAVDRGIHTLVSNYEPHLKRLYLRSGAEIEEIGQADGYGKRPVCCGIFEVSDRILANMRAKLGIESTLCRTARMRAKVREEQPLRRLEAFA
jgi:acyl homoserine lactone synthase